jgi:hypothetical protein
MRVLLVSTYELGHQPLHLGLPAALLQERGHQVRTLDLAIDQLDLTLTGWAEKVAVSVPMHTAMRMGAELVRSIKHRHPQIPVCLYGLYAGVGEDTMADRLISGEYLDQLVEWVEADRSMPRTSAPLGVSSQPQPARALLPPLERYSHLELDGEQRQVGYVEASRGCRHRCRHCPIPVVYDGRYRRVEVEAVMADVEQLVSAGARHITFGDPDFLNGPAHARRVVAAVHAAYPELTFDITAKVEHLLRHQELLPSLVDAGMLFVVSAFETTNDRILGLLDKGHTNREMAESVVLVRRTGADLRPSWLPFTPWTELQDLVDIFEFCERHDLWGSVDPVQLSIRLLIPKGSLLLDLPELLPYLGQWDVDRLTYRWRAADPRTEVLQATLAGIAEEGAGSPMERTLERMWTAVLEAAGEPPRTVPVGAATARPRLTEPWFC